MKKDYEKNSQSKLGLRFVMCLVITASILATLAIQVAASEGEIDGTASLSLDREAYNSIDTMMMDIELDGSGDVDIYIATLTSENEVHTLNLSSMEFNDEGIIEPFVESISLSFVSGSYSFPVCLVPDWISGDYSLYIILTSSGTPLLQGEWVAQHSVDFEVTSIVNQMTAVEEPPDFNTAHFFNPTSITNSYYPLTPNQTKIYLTETDDGVETTITDVLETTKTVNGIECVVFRDRVFEDELLTEDTHDWFAQDDEGNVWYMGEDVVNYTYDEDENVIATDNQGAWEVGKDGALPGFQMQAAPTVGNLPYYMEYLEDEAEDMAVVATQDFTVELENGMAWESCIRTLEWNPLEPEIFEYKVYAPGIGLIREQEVGEEDDSMELIGMFSTGENQVPDFSSAVFSNPTNIDNPYFPLIPGSVTTYEAETEEGVEKIITKVMEDTRMVNGVTCVVFRDRVYLNEVLIEDTYDWFAQDDEGNVWYMGEEVVNYEYDEDGNLIETNSGGSWEAGKDGASAGIQMWRTIPDAGTSYYQEYFEGEAEDMGMVVDQDVTVELENGTVYTNCIKTLDWTPLEPTGLEYKYYAPEIGFIKEEKLGEEMVLELIERN